jgi:hypothetical protein
MTMTVNVNRRVLGTGPGNYALYYKPAADLFETANAAYVLFTLGPLDIPNNVFPTFADAIAEHDSALVAAVVANVDAFYGPGHTAGWSVDGGVENTIVRLDMLDTAVAQKLNVAAIDSGVFVSEAPEDATTDLDLISTGLGTLVGAVNASNTKQNEIAARLNEVVAALQSIGVLKVSP